MRENYLQSADLEIDLILRDDLSKEDNDIQLDTITVPWRNKQGELSLGRNVYTQLIEATERHIQNSHPHLGNVEWTDCGYFQDDEGKTVQCIRLSLQSDFKLRYWIIGELKKIYNRNYVGDHKRAMVPF